TRALRCRWGGSLTPKHPELLFPSLRWSGRPVGGRPTRPRIARHMRPDRRVGLDAVDAWLANRVGSLNPSPLAHGYCGLVSGIGCRTEGVFPKVAERAVSGGIETLSAKEPKVAVRVAPGC